LLGIIDVLDLYCLLLNEVNETGTWDDYSLLDYFKKLG